MNDFELLLFSTDIEMVCRAVSAGLNGIVIDWERRGKAERQDAFGFQIGVDGPEDLQRVRAAVNAPIVCRINGVGATTADEIDVAIRGGATEVLVPMVRKPLDVELVLKHVAGRCGVGILIETDCAVRHARTLARFPLSRVFVGLNDLAIDRGSSNIFAALADGTVERVRQEFHGRFGFGGLTLPESGSPIPCRLLMGEMARLQCTFSVLRRSFHRDIRGRCIELELPRLRRALAACGRRPSEAVERDRQALDDVIGSWVRA